METNTIIWLVLGALGLIVILSGLKVVRPTTRALIERLGKYNRIANPGLSFVIPVIEQIYYINITEMMVDAEQQEIITQDSLNAKVGAQVYFKVKTDETNLKASQYNVNNYRIQIVQLARTTLRNIIGNMDLKDANSKRSDINKSLMATLEIETVNWGIEVVRTELKEIEPPTDVQDTMNKVVKAQNEKIAALDFASARETQADGEKRASIKQAEGIKQAQILKAEGEAQAIQLVNEAAEKYFIGNAQKLKQMEVTQASLQNNSKVIITKDGINPQLIIGNIPVN